MHRLLARFGDNEAARWRFTYGSERRSLFAANGPRFASALERNGAMRLRLPYYSRGNIIIRATAPQANNPITKVLDACKVKRRKRWLKD